ncbi:hypothetical protein OBBRIDRAFT_836765 [Obba rivulosa]|uniref:DUF6699 domain-containing protein n=1 Tax=Obba rivulosa TaxID=1052685 RepID=A0A8E2AP03_9APHY|nr:hypothetical protein OBBRIDRAFT_836765 [Obba rivulosa]
MQFTPVIPPLASPNGGGQQPSPHPSPSSVPVVPTMSPPSQAPRDVPPPAWAQAQPHPHTQYLAPGMPFNPPGSYYIPPIMLPPHHAPGTPVAPVNSAGYSSDWTGFPSSGSAAGGYQHPPPGPAHGPSPYMHAFPPSAMPGFQPLPPGYGPPPGAPHPGATPWPMQMGMPQMAFTPGYHPGMQAWAGMFTPGYGMPGGRPPPGAAPGMHHSTSAPEAPRYRREDANHFAKIDKFAEGPHYGPVLETVVLKKVKARVEINPLLGPPTEGGDHLTWNMLFSTAQCTRSTEETGFSWRAGRQAPATWPRVTHLRLVSHTFPWVVDVPASNLSLGVTCSDVLEAVYAFLQERVTQAQLESAPRELKGVMGEAFRYNRSPEPDVPGGRLPYTMLRCDWLGFDTMFGGITQDERLVRERYGGAMPCTFELRCVLRPPVSETDLDERESRRRRRSRAASRASRHASRAASRAPSRERSRNGDAS